jgi:hypothetical protein
LGRIRVADPYHESATQELWLETLRAGHAPDVCDFEGHAFYAPHTRVVDEDLSFRISVTDGNDIRALFLIFAKLKGQLSQLLCYFSVHSMHGWWRQSGRMSFPHPGTHFNGIRSNLRNFLSPKMVTSPRLYSGPLHAVDLGSACVNRPPERISQMPTAKNEKL